MVRCCGASLFVVCWAVLFPTACCLYADVCLRFVVVACCLLVVADCCVLIVARCALCAVRRCLLFVEMLPVVAVCLLCFVC